MEGIVAVDISTLGIGNKGELPWGKISEDMKWFREKTRGKILVMGSGTYKSLDYKPLPKRLNIVITRNPKKFTPKEGVKFITIEDFHHSNYKEKIIVIGGEMIYGLLQEYINTWYITYIQSIYKYEFDRYFRINLKDFKKVYFDSANSKTIFTTYKR